MNISIYPKLKIALRGFTKSKSSVVNLVTYVEFEDCRLLVCDAVFLVGIDVSEEGIPFIIGVKSISELGTTLATEAS
jgi:hypothetical protein